MGTSPFVAAAAFVLGLAAPAFGQHGELIGVVQNASGAAVPGAVVTVSHPEDVRVRVAITGTRGEYAVKGLDEATEYRVEVSHPRFRKQDLQARPAEIRAQETITLERRRRRCLFARP